MGKIKDRLGWIPNLFTLSNLTLGFLAALIAGRASANGDLDVKMEYLSVAGVLIFFAMLCDGLDGFMARLLDAQSELGGQLDSLADLTTFGIAPGALMYALVLHEFNYEVQLALWLPTGALIAALFPVCTAYRLARFNVSHESNSFSGLPSPIAGIMIGLMPIAFGDILKEENHFMTAILLSLCFVVVAFLMVSTVKYAKPQMTIMRKFSPLRLSLVLIFLIGVLIGIGYYRGMQFGAVGVFSIFALYIVIGIFSLIIHTIQRFKL